VKVAVILFNLGGPDGEEAVKPFLFNLFHDPAIITLGQPWRFLIARMIASRRAPIAREIYKALGGSSPILAETERQGRALEAALGGEEDEYRAFIAMRYWRPFADEAAMKAKAWGAERIVLLPLYPQFSTTTTASSFTDWDRAAAKAGMALPTARICCYYDDRDFIAAHAGRLSRALAALDPQKTRILFSAHGLPEKIVKTGDPYPWQVEKTVSAIMARIGPRWDHVTCFQSRVGKLKWIEPSTDEEVRRAGKDGRIAVVIPIAFVSEHSETLVELDIEYRKLAAACGVPAYIRVPTPGDDATFIRGLAAMVRGAVPGVVESRASETCPARCSCCARV